MIRRYSPAEVRAAARTVDARSLRDLDAEPYLITAEVSAVDDALQYARHGSTADNVWRAFEHLRDNIQTARYIDPANTNNIVSLDCNQVEKASIAAKAKESLGKKTWQEIVW